MSKKASAEEWFARAIYMAKPKSREEEAILMFHAMLLSSGFKCIGAHEDEPESDKELVIPQKWASQKSDGVYGFRYKSENKKHVLQVKIVCTGNMLSSELKLAAIDNLDLKTALQQVETTLKNPILQHIDFYSSPVGMHASPAGANLRPISLKTGPNPLLMYGPQRNDDPYYDIRPNVGQGDLFPGGGRPGNQMGPEDPFFQRQAQRGFRNDPPFPGLGGLGGLGGPGFGRFGPMG